MVVSGITATCNAVQLSIEFLTDVKIISELSCPNINFNSDDLCKKESFIKFINYLKQTRKTNWLPSCEEFFVLILFLLSFQLCQEQKSQI